MENTIAFGMWGQGAEQWSRQTERASTLDSSEQLQLLELLLAQGSLHELLTTFASRVARIVRLHSLLIDCGQPRHIVNGEGAPHHCSFELRDDNHCLLGLLHYGLELPLSHTQQRALQQYHQLLSMPLRLMLRLEQLQSQVRLDHLTGLGNRAHFDEAIGRAVEQNCREHHGLVLVLVDLDRFKLINDTWGHPVGDLVLARFAQLLREVIRTTDQAFRLGGDEFALILQPAEALAWQPVQQRLCDQLRSHQELLSFGVGCSLGAASWQSGMSVYQLYELADADLYRGKSLRP